MNTKYFYDIINSPLGNLLLVGSEEGLKEISFSNPNKDFKIHDSWLQDDTKLLPVKEQLDLYFAKELTKFEIDLAPDGTVFQKQIWNQLLEIPYGEIRSYQDIANSIEKPNACRAIGMANSQNPIPVIIPCHRVIGKNGKLTGYAGGLDIKAKLLQIEGIKLTNTTQQFQLF